MNTEVIDSFTADTIEVGDFISLQIGSLFDEVSVTGVYDYGDHITVEGHSEIHGDLVEYGLFPDTVVHLLGTVSEEID